MQSYIMSVYYTVIDFELFFFIVKLLANIVGMDCVILGLVCQI